MKSNWKIRKKKKEKERKNSFTKKHTPTFNQSGATIWHFFFSFRFTAIQRGILALFGGRRGPYAPWHYLINGFRHKIGWFATKGVPKWKLFFPWISKELLLQAVGRKWAQAQEASLRYEGIVVVPYWDFHSSCGANVTMTMVCPRLSPPSKYEHLLIQPRVLSDVITRLCGCPIQWVLSPWFHARTV